MNKQSYSQYAVPFMVSALFNAAAVMMVLFVMGLNSHPTVKLAFDSIFSVNGFFLVTAQAIVMPLAATWAAREDKAISGEQVLLSYTYIALFEMGYAAVWLAIIALLKIIYLLA